MSARRAKSLMVQGTMSGVGKSLLVAGLCRVLAREGVRVAPFKSQNMALNSAITRDGLEIGRAQAMQAEAAGIEPTAAMNPVLLKPTTNTGSQVIVHGKAIGTMPAREYFLFRASLVGQVREAYEELAREYDVVLIEGAGRHREHGHGTTGWLAGAAGGRHRPWRRVRAAHRHHDAVGGG